MLRRLTLFVVLLLLLAGCADAPDPVPPVAATEPPATEQAAPTATVAPTPTPPSVAPSGFERYEEEGGVFALHYPQGYRPQGTGPFLGDYTYLFISPDGRGAIIVGLFLNDQAEASDREWNVLKADRGLVQRFGSQVALEAMREVGRQTNVRGPRSMRIDMATNDMADEPMRGMLYLEEREGILAVILWALPEEEWMVANVLTQPLLESFDWSPSAARLATEPSLEQ